MYSTLIITYTTITHSYIAKISQELKKEGNKTRDEVVYRNMDHLRIKNTTISLQNNNRSMKNQAELYHVGEYVLINFVTGHPWPAKVIKINKDCSQPYRLSLLGDRSCISLPEFSLLPFSHNIVSQILSNLGNSPIECKLRYAIEITQLHIQRETKKREKNMKKKNKVKPKRTHTICALLQVLNISKLHEKYIPSLPLIHDHDERLEQSGQLTDQTDFRKLAEIKSNELKAKVRKIADRLKEEQNRRLNLYMEDVVSLEKDEDSTLGWDEKEREQIMKDLDDKEDEQQVEKKDSVLDISYAQLPELQYTGSISSQSDDKLLDKETNR